MIRWPDKTEIISALEQWARQLREKYPEIERIGYFGSYARGDWGVGSDLDLVVVVHIEGWREPVDVTPLPVPADVLVYSENQLGLLQGRMRDVIERETIWVQE